MDIDFAHEFAKDWIDSWNSHDIDRIISHYAMALEFKSPLIVKRYSDPDGIIYNRNKLREYFLIGLNNNPNLQFKLIDILLGVNELTLYYHNARGGRTAETFEFDAEKKVIKSVSCYTR